MYSGRIIFRLNRNSKEVLNLIAKKNKTTISKIIRYLIENYINQTKKDMKL